MHSLTHVNSAALAGTILMKLIMITHYRVSVTLITFSRLWVQRAMTHTTFFTKCTFPA